MPKARLYFDGDNTGIKKEARIYSLTSAVETKINSIPAVINNVTTDSSTDALSAKMGMELQEQINNLASRGRYLSTWDCENGLPDTQPTTNPYIYRPGDYYIVSNVGGTNYRPTGSEYHVGVSSQVLETQGVAPNDLYIYDGNVWIKQGGSGQFTGVWGTITGTLSNQVDLQNALNAKANEADVLTKTNTTSYTPTADYHPATKKYVDDNDTHIGTSAPTDNVVEGRLWYDTTNDILKVYNGSQWVPTGKTYTAGRNIAISNADVISATGLQEKLIAGENVTIETECFRSDKGPCPDGFHIATWAWRGAPYTEGWDLADVGKLNDYLATLGVTDMSATMKIPNLRYWAPSQSTSHTRPSICVGWYIRSNSSGTSFGWGWVANPSEERHIRPVKNTPVIPDGSSSWVTLFDGSSIATDAGVFWNEDEGIISVSSDGTNWITVADKNLGATQVWNSGDTLTAANAGNLYQRGNNFGRPYGTTPTTTSEQVDVSSYGPQDYYYREVKFTSSPWMVANNPDLWGWPTPYGARTICQPKISATDTGQTYTAGTGINIDANNEITADTTVLATKTDLTSKQDTLTAGENIQIDTTTNTISATDTTYNAGENITIEDVCTTESDMKGPAPSGFHVPLNTEWQAVYNIWTALGGGSSDGTNFGIALKLPFAGRRKSSSAGVDSQGSDGYYWSSSRNDNNGAYRLSFSSTSLNPQSGLSRCHGYSVRCFKNSPTVPTSSWTKLYGTSIESGGIFWSSTEGLISMSSDGQTWITIADKNLGATTVWNSGDTLSEANCGYYYQRGNNYGFPRTGSVTTSSTLVNASNYGPGNYYSSSTFITYGGRWDSTDNGNLWGGVSQGTHQECIHNVISATDTTYTAGDGVNINQNNEISVDTTVVATQTDLASKQDTLTAGENIQIDTTTNTISATDTTYNAGPGIEIGTVQDYSAMKGPAPTGFHVPMRSEWNSVCGILTSTFGLVGTSVTMETYLKMPMAGYRQPQTNAVTGGNYWESTKIYSDSANKIGFNSSHISLQEDAICTYGLSIRCFKDVPVIPDNTWTTLYDGSSAATGAGVFWNQTDGLISISGDGTTRYTIQDKNLGATTVYNSGDALTDANCGGCFQWGNNYMFPGAQSQDSITTSGTQVDASAYGPGNYYSSSTWIAINNVDWNRVRNDNLWGGVTGVVTIDNVITNTGVLSVNGQTGDVIVQTGGIYTAGNGINIDQNDEISIDTTVVATQTDLSGVNQVPSGGTTGQVLKKTVNGYDWGTDTDTTYSAGTGLTLNGTTFNVDTTTIATKSDIANFGTFVVVDTLPTAASADEKTIYLLGPIGTGADKYEEWIITRGAGNWASTTTMYPFSVTRNTWDGSILHDSQTSPLSDFNGECYVGAKITAISDESKLPVKLSFRDPDSTDSDRVGLNEPAFVYEQYAYPDGNDLDIFIPGTSSSNRVTVSAEGVMSSSPVTWEIGPKQWTKIGETSIDLSTKQDVLTPSTGISIDSSNNISNTLPGPTIAATAPTGTEGALWYDTTNDVLMAYNGTAWEEAGTQMKVLSYGSSTWQDFLDAYNENAIVYCKVSSGSSGYRMAFMAYTAGQGTPTEVEFQYYRSRSSHSQDSTQLDEVYVYKLTNAGVWSTTTRDTGARITNGTGISISSVTSSGITTRTISADTTVLATQTDLSSINCIVSGQVVPVASSQWEGRIYYCTTDNTFYKCDGTAWTEIGSGSIMNDVTGTTSTVTKIWAGTETEYNNLSSYDSTTIYHIY